MISGRECSAASPSRGFAGASLKPTHPLSWAKGQIATTTSLTTSLRTLPSLSCNPTWLDCNSSHSRLLGFGTQPFFAPRREPPSASPPAIDRLTSSAIIHGSGMRLRPDSYPRECLPQPHSRTGSLRFSGRPFRARQPTMATFRPRNSEDVIQPAVRLSGASKAPFAGQAQVRWRCAHLSRSTRRGSLYSLPGMHACSFFPASRRTGRPEYLQHALHFVPAPHSPDALLPRRQ
jgi:hypothetical protein